MYWAYWLRLRGKLAGVEEGLKHAVDHHGDADVEDGRLPGERARASALGSLIVPSKVGEVELVMSSPTMLVSLAGSTAGASR